MIPQHFPIYATIWHPGPAGSPDRIDDSPYVVIGWLPDGGDWLPVILRLGGYSRGPVPFSPFPTTEDERPTLDYADSLEDALATIQRYPEAQRV